MRKEEGFHHKPERRSQTSLGSKPEEDESENLQSEFEEEEVILTMHLTGNGPFLALDVQVHDPRTRLPLRPGISVLCPCLAL